MEAVAQILAIEVGLRGIDRVLGGIDKLVDKLDLAKEEALSLKAGIRQLGQELGFMMAQVREAARWEVWSAQIRGFTGSAKLAQHQMEAIQRISGHGVFPDEQVYEAVRALNRFGAATDQNIKLVERLGARTGDMAYAAEIVGTISTGYINDVMERLRAIGIGPDVLRKYGVDVSKTQIHGTASDVLKALDAISQADGVYEQAAGTFDAKWRSMIFGIRQLLVTLGDPLLQALKPVVDTINGIVTAFRTLNEWTRGWFGLFVQGVTIIATLSKIWTLLGLIVNAQRLAAIWAAIWSGITSGWAVITSILWNIRAVMQVITSWETLMCVWALLWDALIGNWAAIAVAAGIAAALGVGWFFANAHKPENEKSGGRSDSAARRPARRDDIERIHKRMYADAWGG